MKEGLQLKVIHFDNLENRDAEIETDLGIFVDDENQTAHVKLKKYLEKTDMVQPYLGWDQNVYPKFIVKKVIIR